MFRRVFLRQVLFNVLAWWLALYFYLVIGVVGNLDYFVDSPITAYLDTIYIHLEVFFQAFLFGLLFTVINHWAEYSEIGKKSFLEIVLIKSGLYIVSLFVVGMSINLVFMWLGFVDQAQVDYMMENISVRFILAVLLFYVTFILLLNGIIEVSRKLGPTEWLNLLIGKYQQPKVESLIFCFIDMKHSTTIAETLGHKMYSSFIKDCFHFLTPAIRKTKARVYQYVGDEVVLYWPEKIGLQDFQCLNAYFTFSETLRKKQAFFQKKYQIQPEFKAGMDLGEVTITEVGEIKRELAFHGDVLNSAARLEKKCNEYEEHMLISGKLMAAFSSDGGFYFQAKGMDELRGKHDLVHIFSVNNQPKSVENSSTKVATS